MNIRYARQAACALVLPLFALGAPAQTSTQNKPATKAAAKPAAKPASSNSDDKTNSLSGKDVGGKILTREELRACLKRRDDLSTRVTKMDADRAEMEKERTVIQSDQAQLRTDNESMGGLRALADELKTRLNQLQADNEALAKRITAFNENKTMSRSEAEHERNEINATVEALKARSTTLQAERESLIARSEAYNKAIASRNEALQQRVGAWNDRNRKLNTDSESLADERSNWTTECGNRRYREDDEKAIQAGK